jgi:hypothetical protein
MVQYSKISTVRSTRSVSHWSLLHHGVHTRVIDTPIHETGFRITVPLDIIKFCDYGSLYSISPCVSNFVCETFNGAIKLIELYCPIQTYSNKSMTDSEIYRELKPHIGGTW